MANPREISPKTANQVREEINSIRGHLLYEKFNIKEPGSPLIIINGEKRPVPKTVYQAYKEMMQGLKEDPVEALAVYHAHFKVAMRPERGHFPRDERTRAFYQAAASRKGEDIFPGNLQAAKQFDAYLEKAEATIVEFQDKTSSQAKQEVKNVKNNLLEKEFNITGFGFHSIKINGERKTIPKNVYEAYTEMKQGLKENPVQALAFYYAYLKVAGRPAYDHPSRHEETRAFYQEAAARKGDDIFPGNPQAAKQFDDYVKKIEANIAKRRAPEQTKYLEFQDTLKTEINNIQSMRENFHQLSNMIQEMSAIIVNDQRKAIDPEAAKLYPDLLEIDGPDVQKHVEFLGQVIARMQMAASRGDVKAYQEDACIVLDCISPYMEGAGLNRKSMPQLQAHLQRFKNSIRTFGNHHHVVMTSLKDKKNALYISSALEAVSVVAAGPIGNIDGGDLAARALSTGIGVAGSPSGIQAGMEAGSARLGSGFQAIGEGKAREEVLPHVHLADHRTSNVGDMYAKIKAEVAQPDNQLQLRKAAILAGVSVAVPPLAPLIAGLSTAYKVVNIASNAYSQHRLFQAEEEKSIAERTKHEGKMQQYLVDSPNHSRYQERIEVWGEQQTKQEPSAENTARSKSK